MSFLQLVTDQLNLRWAWEKVRRASVPGDVWINEIDLAEFELDLERNLQSIATEIRKGRYRLRPLRPMAFPKNPSKKGEQRVRQYFNLAVRDQIAWTAVVNVIGPYIDPKMPAWSYGNRLFRSIWVDTDNDGIHHRRIGRYRHTSGQIYLPFGQSWPIFRRHVFLTTMAMNAKAGSASTDQMTQEDSEELDLQTRLKDEHRCPFVQKEYWVGKKPTDSKESLFWCSVDLEKFYPSLKLAVVRQNIIDHLPADIKVDAANLIDSMMKFKLDTEGWSEKELAEIGLKANQRSFNAIPTGLFVAGFLANVGLLKVDLAVAERMKSLNVAHFRFVDDHIVLAYSFGDLINWVDEYVRLLADSGTGARVNPEKIEPETLATYFSSRRKSRKSLSDDFDSAAKACKLNPQFPAPLMTKTLALVSAIARIEFDLLDEGELIALTDQLEHMLLVDLPEAEIPEKTRLSFAATRLVRLAECRLSSNASLVQLACQGQYLDANLADKDLSTEQRQDLAAELKDNQDKLQKQHLALEREVRRAFGLLRKVLQERPDRVRLWTRAILMCRQTGVMGLKDIFDDILRVKNEINNSLAASLAAEYLLANTYSLLGSEAIIAARLLVDPNVAEWRRKAARSFLTDISNVPLNEPPPFGRRWFLHTSWKQFCFGIFSADLIIKSTLPEDDCYRLVLPAKVIAEGKLCLIDNAVMEQFQCLAWWAAKPALRELSSHAPSWVAEIGHLLPPSYKSFAFWRFFPFDVPEEVLLRMSANRKHSQNVTQMAGWWYDALGARGNFAQSLILKERSPEIASAVRNLQSASNSRFVSLHEWCDEIRKIYERDPSDPRASEWTALEIVRQIGELITDSQPFSTEYVAKQQNIRTSPLCLHPANFRVPREWLELESLTWGDWVNTICGNQSAVQIAKVPDDLHVVDFRYAPVSSPENALFYSVNPVRGLGLLLYGLLRHDFSLPSVWNGPGHADVLSLLPRHLLNVMTCSSLTLGVLQSCLQPRSMENLFFRVKSSLGEFLDDDSLYDPIQFVTAEQVCKAIEKCKAILVENQLSTINHRARQLTPISIRLLSKPNWTKVFGDLQDEGGAE